MEHYKNVNTYTEWKDAVSFENSILIALREPRSQKNMTIDGETSETFPLEKVQEKLNLESIQRVNFRVA